MKAWWGSPVLLCLACQLIALAACAAEPAPTATKAPTAGTTIGDPFYIAQGGGEPRSAGYWLIWNSCAPDNRSETAAANGGREMGWFIMDDLLADPGVLLGEAAVDSCQTGLNLLQARAINGVDQSGDAAYVLAGQLLTAQLNLAAGAEYCPAVDQAVQAGQLQLLSLGWDGSGRYLAPGANAQDQETAAILTERLATYNAGNLCQ